MASRLYSDVPREAIEGLRDAAGDTREFASVATERYRVTNGILIVI